VRRAWKVLLPLLLAALTAAFFVRKWGGEVVLYIGFPCDSYWSVPGEDYYAFMDAAIEQFEEEHPGVRVEYTSGIRVEDYDEWLSGQILQGTEPDVMVILPEKLTQYSEMGVLQNLESCIAGDGLQMDEFYPAAIKAGKAGNRQYALPLECVPQMMFFNKTLLQEEGISIPDDDWTWNELYSLCAALTKDTDGDGSADQFGIYGYSWKEAMVANGCSLFSENGQQCFLNQEDQQEAVEFAQKLNQLNAGSDISDKTFDEGRVAFRPMFFSEYRSYEPYPWRMKRSLDFEWDCISMPSGTGEKAGNYSQISTLMLGMTKRSRHPRLAWELLKTITCTEEAQMRVYTDLKGASALRGVTESEKAADILRKDSQSSSSIGFQELPVIMEQAYATACFGQYQSAMEQADRLITEAMNSSKNLELQLMEIQRSLQSLLAE
jgi:multiple sugar transport system substrate-binding protein